jgi:serine/threonine protein kinase
MGDPLDPLEGATIAGKYRLERQLGAGSMGAVYLGVHEDLGKRVAIKIINRTFAQAPDATARFRREARAASVIESNHICQVFDAGRDPELGLFMVSEYLVGEDLEQRLERENRLDVVTAASMGAQVARGLAKAHAAGVVHRDLKPANIFLTTRDDGTLLAKILDFGISKVTGAELTRADEEGITAAGVAIGTPLYMSPEQAEGSDAVDGRADVWSLCAVLYEALSGSPVVHDSEKHIEVLMAIVRGDITPIRNIAPWVPVALANVLQAGLVVEPSRRPDAMSIAQRLLLAVPDAAIGFTGPVFPTGALSTLEEPPTTVKPPRSRRKLQHKTEPAPPPVPARNREPTLDAIEPMEESGVVPVAEEGRQGEGDGEEPLQVFERLPSGSLLVKSRKRTHSE